MHSLVRNSLTVLLLAALSPLASAAPTAIAELRAADAKVRRPLLGDDTRFYLQKPRLRAMLLHDKSTRIRQVQRRDGRLRSTTTFIAEDGSIKDVTTDSGRMTRLYNAAGKFDVPEIGRGTVLIASDEHGVGVRVQFEPGQKPVLDGTRRVTIVLGPRDGWTPESKTIEVGSLGTKGDLAHASVSQKKIAAVFGDTPLAAYARISTPTGDRFVNLDGVAGQNFAIPARDTN
jgi:hypothetical protein